MNLFIKCVLQGFALCPLFLSPSTIKHLSPSTETWVFFIKCACKALHYASFFESFHSESFQKQTMQNICFYNIHSAPTHRVTTAVVSSSFKMTLKKKKKKNFKLKQAFQWQFCQYSCFLPLPCVPPRSHAEGKRCRQMAGDEGRLRGQNTAAHFLWRLSPAFPYTEGKIKVFWRLFLVISFPEVSLNTACKMYTILRHFIVRQT